MVGSRQNWPDPEQGLTDELELEIVRYMKQQAVLGVLELTLNDIRDGLKSNGTTRPTSHVSNALALLSDQKRNVLSKRNKGTANFFCLQYLVSIAQKAWGN